MSVLCGHAGTCLRCGEPAVAEVALIGGGPDRCAYGCQKHVDKTVKGFLDGVYASADYLTIRSFVDDSIRSVTRGGES